MSFPDFKRSLRLLPLLILCGAMAGCGLVGGGSSAAEPVAPGPKVVKEEPRNEFSLKATGTDAIILMYHDVLPARTKEALWYDSTTAEFTKDIDRLTAWGATFVSMDEIYAAMANDRPLPPRAVAITFDDNYQGFFDNAWPLLSERRIPVTMYVHTDFVGSSQGRPKMTWDTLKELLKSGHFIVGSHTESHPEDFSKLTELEQDAELAGSKEKLESNLGIKINHLSWPIGKYSQTSIDLAKKHGYLSGVTMETGIAWHSQSLFELNRYNPVKLDEAMADAEREEADPLGYVELTITPGPVIKELDRIDRVPLSLVRGGKPESVLVPGRESVNDLVNNFGGAAGINGGFFQISAIKSTDNRMIGPSLASNMGLWFPDPESARVAKLTNRPMVLFTDTKVMIFPFKPPFNRLEAVQKEVPGLKDAFVAGAWLVHNGKARTKEQIVSHAAQDVMDFRRRAFIGWDSDGRLVIGACTDSYSSDRFAKALAQKGIVEAVLLDSGFSTSVVYGQEILASGHATPEKPSRPIPHAIIVKGWDLGAANEAGSGTGQ